jgi:hypothetical protein
MHIQFSEENGSGLSELRCNGAVEVRDETLEQLCSSGVGDAFNVIEIFQPEGDAVKGSPASSRRDFPLCPPGLFSCQVGKKGDERIQLRFEGFNSRYMGINHLDRGDLFLLNQPAKVPCAQIAEFFDVHRGSSFFVREGIKGSKPVKSRSSMDFKVERRP